MPLVMWVGAEIGPLGLRIYKWNITGTASEEK